MLNNTFMQNINPEQITNKIIDMKDIKLTKGYHTSRNSIGLDNLSKTLHNKCNTEIVLSNKENIKHLHNKSNFSLEINIHKQTSLNIKPNFYKPYYQANTVNSNASCIKYKSFKDYIQYLIIEKQKILNINDNTTHFSDYMDRDNENISKIYSKEFFSDCLEAKDHKVLNKQLVNLLISKEVINIKHRNKVLENLYSALSHFKLNYNTFYLSLMLMDRLLVIIGEELLSKNNNKDNQIYTFSKKSINLDIFESQTSTTTFIDLNSFISTFTNISTEIYSFSISSYKDYLLIGMACFFLASKFTDKRPVSNVMLRAYFYGELQVEK